MVNDKGDIVNSIKAQIVIEYIKKVNDAIANPMDVEDSNDIFDLIIEIANVFQNDTRNSV